MLNVNSDGEKRFTSIEFNTYPKAKMDDLDVPEGDLAITGHDLAIPEYDGRLPAVT